MVKLWCIYWDRGTSNVKFNLFTRSDFFYRLGTLLTHWRQFEVKLQVEFSWVLKGPPKA